ncbi:hypothetical protein CEXT_321861 [Caerostris extrusa]|uniref:Uncharacterized protein n=1 Tax=Caerostris extrusa TaxID=172846 RepID=A0AAV4V393_CAEEX|nr:hypothetical protein CEXT_321861 [Caerostris extrusa]
MDSKNGYSDCPSILRCMDEDNMTTGEDVANLNLLMELDSSPGLVEDMDTSKAIFEHGTSTREEIDSCAVEESILQTRSIMQKASPENPSLKSIVNPEIRQLSPGEDSSAKPSNESVCVIGSVPKTSDYYHDNFQLITYRYSVILEGMINGSVKEFVKRVFAIFFVYRSHVEGGLTFHRTVMEWLTHSNVSETKYGYIYLVTYECIRSLQKLKEITDHHFEIFRNKVSALGRAENIDSLPDFISADIETNTDFNKHLNLLVCSFFTIANSNYSEGIVGDSVSALLMRY